MELLRGGLRLLLFLAVTFASPSAAHSNPLSRWHLRHEFTAALPPSSGALQGVAFANGSWVAVGNEGTILTTPDADSVPWVIRPGGTTNDLVSVVSGNGLFVAVGSKGTILTSTNGIDWARQQSGVSSRINRLIQAAGRFVAVGESGLVLSSTDGFKWTRHTIPVDGPLSAVAHGDGTFVVAGVGSVWLSNDLESWRSTATPAFAFSGMTYHAGRFVGIGQGLGGFGIFASRDGASWEPTAPSQSRLWVFHDVAYVGDRFIVAGGTYEPRTFRSIILTSPDGIQWTERETVGPSDVSAVAFGNGRFVAVGWGASGPDTAPGQVLTSRDASSWTLTSPAPTIYAVLFTNDTFTAVGDAGVVLISRNGIEWQRLPIAIPANLRDIASNGQVHVAVGAFGKILRSTDGVTWSLQASPTRMHLTGVTFGNGLFAVVGSDLVTGSTRRTILTSPNGIDWTEHTDIPYGIPDLAPFSTNAAAPAVSPAALTRPIPPPNSSGALFDVAFGNDRFVAVGGNMPDAPQPTAQTIITSRDGLSWSGSGTLYPPVLRAIVFGNSRFVAVGHDRSIYSPFPANRTVGSFGSVYNNVGHVGGTFMIVGSGGLVAISSDATAWAVQPTGASRGFHGVAYGRSTFVVVGESGAIVQSDPLITGQERPPLLNPVRGDGEFTISVPTAPDRRYIFEFTNDLAQPVWNSLPPVNGDGTLRLFTDRTADRPWRFYRMRVESSLMGASAIIDR